MWKPSAARRSAVLGPMPGISRGEWRARRTQASSRPSTTKPRGLSRSDATLAISRFGATPTEIDDARALLDRVDELAQHAQRLRTSVRSA